jgi:hypothetical protein
LHHEILVDVSLWSDVRCEGVEVVNPAVSTAGFKMLDVFFRKKAIPNIYLLLISLKASYKEVYFSKEAQKGLGRFLKATPKNKKGIKTCRTSNYAFSL